MHDDDLTLDRIDELLQYLPRLGGDGVKLRIGTAGGERIADNVHTTRYPIYPDVLLEFFHIAGQTWWTDFGYASHPASKRLDDAEFIAKCSLDEIRTMLTACVRGERFADGFWAHCLASGVIERLLRRLATLRSGLGRDEAHHMTGDE